MGENNWVNTRPAEVAPIAVVGFLGMADEKTPSVDSAAAADAAAPKAEAPAAAPKAAPKAAAKKEKPPALEDKPFTEFIEQHFIPSLETALKEKGIDDIQLDLDQQPLGVFGVSGGENYWHVKGKWQQGDRQFNIAFTEDDIKSPKVFYLADRGAQPSTIEQFMGDERKITLDLMVLYTLQRLNGQKWLTRN
jgi:pyruvate/2-oxoglutarate dehydrogenase complex dihydrolipoamide acyltransferase (E2) component